MRSAKVAQRQDFWLCTLIGGWVAGGSQVRIEVYHRRCRKRDCKISNDNAHVATEVAPFFRIAILLQSSFCLADAGLAK